MATRPHLLEQPLHSDAPWVFAPAASARSACHAATEQVPTAASGIQEATGASNYSVDFPNTKMVVFIGRSYGDGPQQPRSAFTAHTARAVSKEFW